MHSTSVWTTVIASSFGLALAAQTAVGTAVPSNHDIQPSGTAAPTAMTGCLQRSDQAVHYKLTHTAPVASGGAMLDAAKFTPAVSGKTPPDKTAPGPHVTSMDLALVTQVETIRFDEHVGHQVEVIGYLEQVPTVGTAGETNSPAATGTAGATPAAPRPMATMGTQTLNVNVLRLISKRCP
jgi:hypothetical protein